MYRMIHLIRLAAPALLLAGCSGRKAVSVPAGAPAGLPAVQAERPPTDAVNAMKLEKTGFQCGLVVADPPGEWHPGDASLNLKVTLTNQSPRTWIVHHPEHSDWPSVNLAYRWRCPDDIQVAEGNRFFLPKDLAPGESATIDMTINPPPAAGSYKLRIEPVQETVAWFSEAGGCFQDIRIAYQPEPANPPHAISAAEKSVPSPNPPASAAGDRP